MLEKISDFWKKTQLYLFPFVEEVAGPISPLHQKLTAVLELIQIEKYIDRNYYCIGRPSKDRVALARAFVAKVVFKLKYTSQLRDYLLSDKQLRIICGWEPQQRLPSLSKFSRVFNEFATSKLPDKVHKALIEHLYTDQIIENVVVDSTPIEAREKAVKTEKNESQTDNTKMGRLRKGEKRQPKLTRAQKQASGTQSLEEMISELPKNCSKGMKKKPGLANYVWKGYKLHLAVDEYGVPLTGLVTSASINDHEAAIPISNMTNQRVNYLYQIMDSAYDVKAVIDYIKGSGQVPIVDKKPYNPKQKAEKKAELKRQKILNWQPVESRRYKKRRKGERPNALIKEYYGASNIQYKGHTKVSCQIMFGVLTLAASQILLLV